MMIGRHPLSWRSCWLRSVLALLVLTLSVRLIWGWQAGRMLRAQLDQIRQRGEPVAVEDVRFVSVPDGENAWYVQVRASQALVPGVDSPRNSNDDFRGYPPYPDFWIKRAEASERSHGRAFALARQARQLSRVQFRDRLTSPLSNMMLPYLNNARQLANTLADGANYAEFRGDDGEVIERLMDVLHLARSLRQDDFVVSQLVAIGIDALALEAAQISAPRLRLQSGVSTRPATHAQVRQLIDQILDERVVWEQITASLRMERLATIDFFHTRADGAWMIGPLAGMDMVRANRNLDIALQASALRDKPSAFAVLARTRWEENSVPMSFIGNMSGGERTVPRYSRWFLGWNVGPTRYFETNFRSIGERRATAVSLAAQLYRADHGGRWPERLEELVPTYLPAVPVDPFHDDGRPLGYVIKKGGLPGGGDRPLVYYDAGEDDPAAIQDEPMYSFHQVSIPGKGNQVLRQYHDIARFEPPPPPSTQAVDDDPKKADAPRDKPEQDNPAK
jgi:hypothetical protein